MGSLIDDLMPSYMKKAKELGRELSKDELYVAQVLRVRDIESDVFKDALKLYRNNKEKVRKRELSILTKDDYTYHKNPMEVIEVTEHCIIGRYLREW